MVYVTPEKYGRCAGEREANTYAVWFFWFWEILGVELIEGLIYGKSSIFNV